MDDCRAIAPGGRTVFGATGSAGTIGEATALGLRMAGEVERRRPRDGSRHPRSVRLPAGERSAGDHAPGRPERRVVVFS